MTQLGGQLVESLQAVKPLVMPRYPKFQPEQAPTLKPIPSGGQGDFRVFQRGLPAGAALQFYDTSIRWPQKRSFTILAQGSQVWMSDTPQETVAMAAAAKMMSGEVLVTGLGLAIFQRCLSVSVTHCTTIELQPEVCALVWKHLQEDGRQHLLQGDAKDLLVQLEAEGKRFNFVFLDTWDSGDYEQLPWVNWHIRQAQKLLKPKGKVHAWAHARMLRSFAQDAIALAKEIGKSKYARENKERRAGTHRRWPLMGLFLDWYWDENPQQPDAALIRKWCNFVGRRITQEPGQMFRLTKQREAEAWAAEARQSHV